MSKGNVYNPIRFLVGPPPNGVPVAYWNVVRQHRMLLFLPVLGFCTMMILGVPIILDLFGFITLSPRGFSLLPMVQMLVGFPSMVVLWVVPPRLRSKYAIFVRSQDYRVCMECGYCLRGLDDNYVCPECGSQYEMEKLVEQWNVWCDRKTLA